MSSPAARTALTAEHLVADFGLKAPRAQRAIRALYTALCRTGELPQPFEQWKVLYSEAADYQAGRFESKEEFRQFVAGLGIAPPAGASQVFFAVHTYYALLLKLIAALALGKPVSEAHVRKALSRLESGVPFREAGIRNFLDGDLFHWYLAAWDGTLQEAAAELVHCLSRYGPPEQTGDFLKKLYLQLLPREIRHDLGEHYTPDALAEKLLADTLGESAGDPNQRVLDPSCGSGTFLVLLIRSIKRRAGSKRPLDLLLRNVIGFDLNPLAVLAARTNYLLALGDWLSASAGEIEIPVYQADAVLLTPATTRFENTCDFVVGNPPWVNWEHLPETYRRATRPLWEHYRLFPKRAQGIHTILGGAKYDLSMLMTYVAADRYLRAHGKLGFVVSQTLFKSASAGQGFRRFRLPDGTPIAPTLVEDMVQLKPFDGAANRTATLVLEKGRALQFPVDYRFHNRRQGASYLWRAQPVSAADPASPWLTARPGTLAAVTQILGASPYRAREGANTGGANGVFWMEVTGKRAGGQLRVRNVTKGARKKVPETQALVEARLVYPLLRGQNVSRWSAMPDGSVLMTHQPGMKLRAIPETEMAQAFPRACSYLLRFRPMLRARPAYRRYFHDNAPFYSLFNIGDYTFAEWKVVWREQALPFTAAVAGPLDGRVVIPDHKLMLVPAESEEEAHYLCGVLNSLPVSAAVAAYTIEIQIATHVLDYIAVPRFDRKNSAHRRLASASRRAHAAVRDENRTRLERAEADLNREAAQIWGLSEDDLEEMRAFLREAGVTSALPT